MNKTVKVNMTDLYPVIVETFKNNQIAEIKVKGSSMKPFLKDSESIVGLKEFPGQLKRYHIYFFKIDDKYILHRYLRKRDDLYLFRGDALYKYEAVNKENIFAEVTYINNNHKIVYPYSFWNMFRLSVFMSYKRLKIFARYIIGRDND